MGIKSKRVDFTFDESSLHIVEEPQGYAPRESPRITDVLLMNGRTVRIPPVQRFKEPAMSDKVMVEREALARVLERAETYTDGMPCCDFCSAHGPALPLVHDADCPSLPLAAALAPAPAPAAASSGAEAERLPWRKALTIEETIRASEDCARWLHSIGETHNIRWQLPGGTPNVYAPAVSMLQERIARLSKITLASAPAGAE